MICLNVSEIAINIKILKNAAYNCTGCLGKSSPSLLNTTPRALSVRVPAISELKKFDRLYLSRVNNKAVRGTMEGLQFKNIVLEYNNFQTDICAFIREYNRTITPDASGIWCSKSGNNYHVLAQGSFWTNLKPDTIWTDLTSSLRIR